MVLDQNKEQSIELEWALHQWSKHPFIVIFWVPQNWTSTIIIIIYSLPARVVGAPQMISQPVFSIVPCSPLPSGTWRTPGLSIPWCCLPTSSSVCLVFFPFSLCLGGWFWLDLMNGRHDYTAAVCVSLRDQHKEQSQHCISGVSILFLSYFGFHGTGPA